MSATARPGTDLVLESLSVARTLLSDPAGLPGSFDRMSAEDRRAFVVAAIDEAIGALDWRGERPVTVRDPDATNRALVRIVQNLDRARDRLRAGNPGSAVQWLRTARADAAAELDLRRRGI